MQERRMMKFEFVTVKQLFFKFISSLGPAILNVPFSDELKFR